MNKFRMRLSSMVLSAAVLLLSIVAPPQAAEARHHKHGHGHGYGHRKGHGYKQVPGRGYGYGHRQGYNRGHNSHGWAKQSARKSSRYAYKNNKRYVKQTNVANKRIAKSQRRAINRMR